MTDHLLGLIRADAVGQIGADTEQTPLQCPGLEDAPGTYTCTSTVKGEPVTWTAEVTRTTNDDGTVTRDVKARADFGTLARNVEHAIQKTYRKTGAVLEDVTCPDVQDRTPLETTCRARFDGLEFDIAFNANRSPDGVMLDYGVLPIGVAFRETIEEQIAEDIGGLIRERTPLKTDPDVRVDCDAAPFFALEAGVTFACNVRVMATGATGAVRFAVADDAGLFSWTWEDATSGP